MRWLRCRFEVDQRREDFRDFFRANGRECGLGNLFRGVDWQALGRGLDCNFKQAGNLRAIERCILHRATVNRSPGGGERSQIARHLILIRLGQEFSLPRLVHLADLHQLADKRLGQLSLCALRQCGC